MPGGFLHVAGARACQLDLTVSVEGIGILQIEPEMQTAVHGILLDVGGHELSLHNDQLGRRRADCAVTFDVLFCRCDKFNSNTAHMFGDLVHVMKLNLRRSGECENDGKGEDACNQFNISGHDTVCLRT